MSNSGRANGGFARAKSLDSDRRREIAQKAAKARWAQPNATPKEFVLRKRVWGAVASVPITSSDFDEYRKARVVLTNALAIEEKYEILVSNYLDLEREVLSIAAKDMVRADWDYEPAFLDRLALNRRVVNVLTAARLYLDQIGRHVEICGSVPDSVDQLRLAKSREFDQWFEYRFMEALRNHAQHNGTPVHWTTHGSAWIDDRTANEYTIAFGAERVTLENDPSFSKRVLAQMPARVDLRIAIRKYMESISTVHVRARELAASRTEAARSLMREGQQKYLDAGGGDTIGLGACAIDASGNELESVALLLDWDDVRQKLIRKNGHLKNLHLRFASGRSRFAAEDAAKNGP